MNALKNRKNYNILEDERPSKAFHNLENAKKGYNEVILLNKDNPNYDPTKAESDGNTRLVPITDRQGMLYKSFLIVVETPRPRNTSIPKPSLMKKAME